jgi:predicted RNA methylase
MPTTIKRKDIEKRLSDFCNVSEISSLLSETEKNKLFDLSLQFAIDSVLFENAGNRVLGVNVAQSIVRNYLMSLLTGNAVKYSQKIGLKNPVVIEMGMGSGLNGVAALTINKNSYYLGVDNEDLCIDFACRMFTKYKLENNVEIIKGDYSNVKFDRKADLVINENFGPNLVEEAAVIASNAVLPYTHNNTICVPGAVNIFGIFNNRRTDFVKIKFNEKIPLNISFSKILPTNKSISFQPGCDLYDFQGKIAVSQKSSEDYISYLPLIGEPIPVRHKNKKPLKISFDFKKKQIIIE